MTDPQMTSSGAAKVERTSVVRVVLWAAVSAGPTLAGILGLASLAVVGLAVWRRDRVRSARPRRDPAPMPTGRARAVPVIALVGLVTVVWAGGWDRAADLIRAVDTAWAAPF